MSHCIASFSDSVAVELTVYVPWWNRLLSGIINQSVNGQVTLYRTSREAGVSKEPISAEISINALFWVSNRSGQWLVEAGTKTCASRKNYASVFVCTKTVYPTGFLFPPWMGGSKIEGIGYNALIRRGLQSISLQCHFGDKSNLPETHISK